MVQDTFETCNHKFKLLENSLLFSGELLETGSIHDSGYWKIAGLTTCYFQGNSWKLGASTIQVIMETTGNFEVNITKFASG